MARRRTAGLILVATLSIAVVLGACGRSGFLGDDATPSGSGTPTGTPTGTTSPTPTPVSSRFPTPGPTATIGFGGGNVDGSLALSAAAVINSCYAVSWASNSTIAFDASPAAPPLQNPHHYLLWQVQSSTLNTAGRPTGSSVVDFNGAGLWEVVQANVWDVGMHELSIQNPMAYRYRTLGFDHAQVCHIPEYDNAAVNATGLIKAQRWDGRTGGVVALMVSGNFGLNDTAASIDASSAGLRGGVAGLDDGPGNGQITTAIDSLVATTGGQKGESFDGSAHERYASGAIGSGGGGGNNDCGAAGGGGNGGVGGFGGNEFQDTPNSGGAGGAAAGLQAPARLLLGGGGGGGATHNTKGSGGAAGGGVVLIFANVLQNGGAILAVGSSAAANSTGDGGGGGGAGGTIVIYSGTSTWTGTANADGGKGSNNSVNHCGTGGGGAGGQLTVPIGTIANAHCRANGGVNGTSSNGARAGQTGGSGAKSGNCPP